jgi:hypothetical protein
MRVILWLALGLGVLWGGYWFVGARMIEGGVNDWFAQSGTQGIEATQDGISVAGFANRFDLTVTNPQLRDPVTGWGWQAPFAQVFAMTWKPWHVIAALPHTQTIVTPDQSIDLASSRLQASLRLKPVADLPLEEVVLAGDDVLLTSTAGWRVAAKSVVAAMARQGDNGQRLGLDVAGLTPDPVLTAKLPELGPVLDLVHLDATLTLSAPLDRHMAQTQPRMTGVKLTAFNLTWGKLVITASGDVVPGADGLALGKLAFRFQNWRSIPALLVEMGLVLPGMGNTITRGLDVMARSGPDPELLAIDLVFADGRMMLGPLPLGPAPRLN